MSRGKRRLLQLGVIGLVLGASAGLAIAAVGDNDSPPSSPLTAEQVQEKRVQLTNMLNAMEYHGATEADMEPVLQQLAPLGGPDPAVPSFEERLADRPEWMVEKQRQLDRCHAGDEALCQQIDQEAQEGFEASK